MEYIFVIVLLVVFRYPDAFGMTNSLCYIRKNDNSQTSLCKPPTYQVECCSRQHISVDKIEVYSKSECESVNQCGSGDGCCTAHTLINISTEYKAALEDAFKSTNCFNSVDERFLQSQLPKNEGLDHIIVSYTCTAQTTPSTTKSATATTTTKSTTTTTQTTTQQTTTTTKSTTTTQTTTQHTTVSDVSDEDSTTVAGSISSGQTEDDDKTNIAAAVAVPITLIVVIAVVVVGILYMRRRAANKEHSSQEVDHPTSYNGSLPKYAPGYMDNAALPSTDDTVNNEYAEIPGNSVLESGNYNVIDPILHAHTTKAHKGYVHNGKQIGNEDYDHIGIHPPTNIKEGETYSHIQHATPKNSNNGKGGKFDCTDTYAHIAHGSNRSHNVHTSDVDVGTYDTTSSLNGSRGQGEDTLGTDGYDRTNQRNVSPDGDDYGYAHVPAGVDNNSRDGGKGPTNTAGMNSQNEQGAVQHSYFVLEKQFK